MKKHCKVLVLVIIMGVIGITTVFAAGGIKSATFTDYELYFKNEKIQLSNPLATIIKDGNSETLTYIPAREFLEKSGYTVNWDSSKHSIHLYPKVVSNHDEFNNQEFPLVAADYDEEAYLYAIGSNQAVLKYMGISKAFDWICTTPRLILPRIQVLDYDKDGEKEVAVSLNVGTGTGINLYELHIVTPRMDVAMDYDDLIDHKFVPEDYMKQIFSNVSYAVTSDNDKTVINISFEKNSVTIDITDYAKEISAINTEIMLACGSIVEFALKEDGTIAFSAALGVNTEKYAAPMYIEAVLTAAVMYSNGEFTLSDIQINES